MATGLDMSLDNIIKSSAAAPRRRVYGPGPDRRFTLHNLTRTTPYATPKGRQANVVQEMVLDGAAAESGTKLYISNLDYGVSNQDIKLLFSEEGELKRYSIHYDKSGRSKGTAEVVFTRRSDALTAIEKYNNMRLDGKSLQIELVGTSLDRSAVISLCQYSLLGRPNNVLGSERGRVGGSRFHIGFARGHLPRGHGKETDHAQKVSFRDLDHDLERYHRHPRFLGEVKGHIGKVSVRDLDADLERYHLEAMQINEENGK